MARLHDIVIDCGHPASLARFWTAVLDGYSIAPYDEAELARLRGMGIDDPEDDPSVLVEGPGQAPRIWFTRVPERKIVKNRVHLDLQAGDLVAELDQIQALGASVEARHGGHVVLTDPEGNEFCLFPEKVPT